jgi:type IV pilus assembly protein PilY1
MDVTNPQNITTESQLASSVLWEFTDADMGLSYSQPQVAPISVAVPTGSTATQSYAVFFGNGYNSPNNNAVLYAVNPQTGALIQKINLCAAITGVCNAGVAEGLSTVAVANSDGLLGQPITQIYAGDLQGNLWAVDVSNPNPAQWTVRLLFQARDSNGNPQPITTQPVVTLNPNYPRKPGLFVIFGTGQLLTQSDLSSQQTQSVYGVWDKPGASTVFTRTNLQQQTLSLVSAATSGLPQAILTDTSNSVNWGTQVGWYEDFPTPGERVVVNPGLLNGSFQATLNTPPSNLCNAGYTAMFLDINYLSGGAFQQPQLDVNGSGSITPTNNYNGTNPVGIALNPGFASQGVVLTNGGSSGSTGSSPATSGYAYVMFTDPITGKHYWKLVPLNQVPRSAWWQIQ